MPSFGVPVHLIPRQKDMHIVLSFNITHQSSEQRHTSERTTDKESIHNNISHSSNPLMFLQKFCRISVTTEKNDRKENSMDIPRVHSSKTPEHKVESRFFSFPNSRLSWCDVHHRCVAATQFPDGPSFFFASRRLSPAVSLFGGRRRLLVHPEISPDERISRRKPSEYTLYYGT